MTNHLVHAGSGQRWRIIGWGLAVGLLVLPFVAMRFTREVNWTPSDFVFAAILLGSIGLGMEFAVRRSSNAAYRGGAALALLASFLTVWINGAVGMIGSEDNPYNLLFALSILAALIGAILTRFRPQGMARATIAAGIVQASLGLAGMFTDLRGGILTTVLASLWVLAAALFRKAEQDRAA